MAEVNRKSVSSLIRAYGEVNPDAVVRLMQQYQNMEESRAKEETEEIMMNAEVLGNLGGGVIGNLSDFRTAKAGGYEKGYFKFLIEKPENISSFMDDGKNRIDNATGREKELLTALFPKAKQKHFDRIDAKAEKYGLSGESWEKLSFKEKKDIMKEGEYFTVNDEDLQEKEELYDEEIDVTKPKMFKPEDKVELIGDSEASLDEIEQTSPASQEEILQMGDPVTEEIFDPYALGDSEASIDDIEQTSPASIDDIEQTSPASIDDIMQTSSDVDYDAGFDYNDKINEKISDSTNEKKRFMSKFGTGEGVLSDTFGKFGTGEGALSQMFTKEDVDDLLGDVDEVNSLDFIDKFKSFFGFGK